MYFRLFLLVAVFSLLPKFAHTQQFSVLEMPKPEVGKPCPEFTLTHVTHYDKKKVTLSDFKGKWLVLDFWYTGCTACIHSFPKINELQKQFKDKVQFVLVGQNSKRYYKNVEVFFERLSAKQQLNIAAAYDSTLAPQWGIRAMPYIIIVDPQGIVRSITDGNDMSKEKIQSLLNGETPTFSRIDLIPQQFEVKFTSKNGSDLPKEKVLSYSVLTEWNGEKFNGGYEVDQYASYSEGWEKDFRVVGVSLQWLYSLAYFGKSNAMFKFRDDPLFGKICPFPLLELKDTSKFVVNYSDGSGLYNYCLRSPAEQITRENIMLFLQQDLKKGFGYSAVVEERDMPVWELIAKPEVEQKVKTKGGLKYYSSSEGSIAAGFTVRNAPMKGFITNLTYYLYEKENYPFIDATGITSNIDITIDADMTSFSDVKRELNKHGLDFALSKRKMKVLVIRDQIF
jgi:thiol-disulfide isomerase/thioredoxin